MELRIKNDQELVVVIPHAIQHSETQIPYVEEKELKTLDSRISLIGVENLGEHCIIWSMCKGQQAEVYS